MAGTHLDRKNLKHLNVTEVKHGIGAQFFGSYKLLFVYPLQNQSFIKLENAISKYSDHIKSVELHCKKLGCELNKTKTKVCIL